MNAADPIKFLLVEDNEDHTELISQIFEDQGLNIQLECVTDGEQALAFLKREREFEHAPRPQIVILDLNLPGMSGITVLKEIKGDVDLMTIPVVVLTTSNIPKDRELAYDWCANSYITKPVDFSQFTETIAQMAMYWTVFNRPPLFSMN